MSKINCIIIEDEKPAREILKGYLEMVPDWEVAAEFSNAVDAIGFLSRHSVDVIFLDIQLPKLSGIGFIRALENPPLIVISTAYGEHAVEAFELTVFDYLLKPYPFARFLKAINRINGHFQNREKMLPETTEHSILVRENRENIKLPVREILYVESQKEYVHIVCATRTIKTRMSITKIEELLVEYGFLRVHRSFLVALKQVEAFSRRNVTIGKFVIPIGRHYQKEVRNVLG